MITSIAQISQELYNRERKEALDKVKTFDPAIPQAFADDVRAKTGLNAFGHIVWLYDNAKIWGEPYPVSSEGRLILTAYQHIEGEHKDCTHS